jgi:hypothetical protein
MCTLPAWEPFTNRAVADLHSAQPDYLEWVLSADFPEEFKEKLRSAIKGTLAQSQS